jgi:2-polyprenyl-3-methyl-5-hydroxy-6-metoxy-1,4-benzoquinol methylase
MTQKHSQDQITDATPIHEINEHMFDTTSVEYQTDVWFEPSMRSPYVYDITHRRLVGLLRLCGDEDVFEIGCGPGTWTRIIASQAHSVTALDISRSMIEKAQSFVQPYDVNFIHSDVLQYTPTRTYDRVVSLRAIEYVVDRVALVERLASLVRDGGELVIVSKTPFSIWRGRRWLASIAQRMADGARAISADASPIEASHHNQEEPFYMKRISPWHLARLLRNTGFDNITVYPVIVGLPILAGIHGDVPLIPQTLAPRALRAFNWLGDRLTRSPQSSMRLTMWLSESYALRAHRRPRLHREEAENRGEVHE